LLVMANVFVAWRHEALERARQKNLLATATQQSAQVIAGARFDVSVGEHLEEYLPAIPDARLHRLVLLVGMSQMYAITEQQPLDENTAEILDDRLRASNTRVFGLSAPNLTHEEALFLLVTASTNTATTPNVFIFGLCFDKMRGSDLRPGYQRLLRSRPQLRANMSELADRYEARYPLAATKIRATLAQLAQEAGVAGADSSLEEKVRSKVADVVPLVAARKELNQVIMYDVLYAGRNKLLGITSSSKRPILPAQYELNKQFLMMMIDESKRRNIEFVMYIIPLNQQAEIPYVASEYEDFKRWAAQLANRTATPFANLENVVPPEDWGTWMGGPDFKHFKAGGHRRTADAILEHFGNVVTGATTRVTSPAQ